MVKNKHKVPLRQWKKWGDTGQAIFNAVYEDVLGSQGILIPPKMDKVKPKDWEIIAWNVAFISASHTKSLVEFLK
jgi:hypothetical protein